MFIFILRLNGLEPTLITWSMVKELKHATSVYTFISDISDDPEDMLPRALCMDNLVASRRTSFFTSTAPRLLNCICISRIIKVVYFTQY